VRFTIPFLKKLLGQQLEVEDLKAVDSVLYRNKIEGIMRCTEDELAELELDFTQESTMFGATSVVDLLNGMNGSEEAVTIGNRGVYLRLLTNHLLTHNIAEQTSAVAKGLQEVIPTQMLKAMSQCLTPEELDVVIAGMARLDLEDWRRYSVYEEGYDAESQQVLWFWEVLGEWEQSELKNLLICVTGSGSVGPAGFAHLQGYSGEEHRFTLRCSEAPGVGGGAWSLPKASTCFNVLILPPYPSKEVLREKLVRFVAEGVAGGGFDEGAVAV